MSTTKPIDEQPLDELDAQLVAYLDGELEHDQRQALEERLMDDADCKQRLRMLQQSFDMLEELPRLQVNQDFARTTVEMVALSASQELQVVKKRKPFKYGSFIVGLIAASVIAFGAGLFIVREGQRVARENSLEKLVIAENLRAYLAVKSEDDLAFFERLAASEVWNEHIAMQRQLDRMPDRESEVRLASIPIDAREQHLAAMAPELRRDLRMQFEQLSSQSVEQQAKLKSVCDKIQSRPSPDQLLSTIVAYVDWMDNLGRTDKSKIQKASPEGRFDLVMKRLEKEGRSADYLAEVETIYKRCYEVAAGQLETLKTQASEQQLAEIQEILDREKGDAPASESVDSKEDLFTHLLVKAWVLPSMHRFMHDAPSWTKVLPPMEDPVREELLTMFERTVVNNSTSGESRRVAAFHLMLSVRRMSPIENWPGSDPLRRYLEADDAARERYDLQNPRDTLRDLRYGNSDMGGRSRGHRPPPSKGFGSGRHDDNAESDGDGRREDRERSRGSGKER